MLVVLSGHGTSAGHLFRVGPSDASARDQDGSVDCQLSKYPSRPRRRCLGVFLLSQLRAGSPDPSGPWETRHGSQAVPRDARPAL